MKGGTHISKDTSHKFLALILFVLVITLTTLISTFEMRRLAEGRDIDSELFIPAPMSSIPGLGVNFIIYFGIGLFLFCLTNKVLKYNLTFIQLFIAELINFSAGITLKLMLRAVFDNPLFTDGITSITAPVLVFIYFSRFCKLSRMKSVIIILLSFIIEGIMNAIFGPIIILMIVPYFSSLFYQLGWPL